MSTIKTPAQEFAQQGGKLHLALVHDIFGHWTLSKGKIADRPEFVGENVEDGTKRRIKEELGLDLTLKEKLGENEYVASDPELGKKRKHVTYFLAESPFVPLQLEQKGGLDDAKWFSAEEVLELNLYDDMRPLVVKAVDKLTKGKNKS